MSRVLGSGTSSAPSRGSISALGSYTQKLWMGLKKKAAYLPGC
jgi:hypothetical protein